MRIYVYWSKVELDPGRCTFDTVNAFLDQLDGSEVVWFRAADFPRTPPWARTATRCVRAARLHSWEDEPPVTFDWPWPATGAAAVDALARPSRLSCATVEYGQVSLTPLFVTAD